MRGLCLLCACLSLGWLVGCQGSVGNYSGELTQAYGTVVINEEPGVNVQLTFIPTSGTGGGGALGITNENGSFTVKHRSGKPGIEPGTYKVLFSQFIKPDGSALGPEEDAATMGVERFPEQYQFPEQTPEEVTISSTGEDSLLFEITLKNAR